jgi:hypothetical protein
VVRQQLTISKNQRIALRLIARRMGVQKLWLASPEVV